MSYKTYKQIMHILHTYGPLRAEKVLQVMGFMLIVGLLQDAKEKYK